MLMDDAEATLTAFKQFESRCCTTGRGGKRESVETIRSRTSEITRQYHEPNCGSECGVVINGPHESLVHVALIEARISFETQVHPGGLKWESDIILMKKPVIIEVTGNRDEARGLPRRQRKTDELKAAGYFVWWVSSHHVRVHMNAIMSAIISIYDLSAEDDPVFKINCHRKGLAHEQNPIWKGGKIDYQCQQCGKSFMRGRGHGYRFCSNRCYGDWMHTHPESLYWRPMDRDWSDLRSLYDAGMSVQQLASHYECSGTAIHNAMVKLGIEKRPQGGRRIRGGLYQSNKNTGS